MKLSLLMVRAKPAAPAGLYLGGLAAFVVAGFMFAAIAGVLALGASLILVGYMAEVNQ